MKKYRMGIRLMSLLLMGVMAVNLTGCAKKIEAKNLMDDIKPNTVNASEDLSTENREVTDFAMRLFKAGYVDGENMLISPLSVLSALAMTANGAQDETLLQMENTLGMTKDKLNRYVYSYMENLPQGKNYKLSLANSIWFTEDKRFTVNQDFLQTNADYYGAGIYRAPFNDETCEDINRWVKDNTDGMIEKIINNIPAEAVMYLVNALAFEAEWSDIYEKHQVREGVFTKEDGSTQEVKLMYGSDGAYLEDENASGFIKYYKGGKYAFVAMLPKEGVKIADYVATLDGEKVSGMLQNPKYVTVRTAIPKFKTGYEVEMSGILTRMGMERAFDEKRAEFGALGTSTDGNIFISRVLHKTFIEVGEKGTRAGAATVVEKADGAAMEMEEPKEVYLDRPFVYMIIDCENNIPFFIGTMMDAGSI